MHTLQHVALRDTLVGITTGIPMSEPRITPAERAVQAFGSCPALAEAIKRNRSSVWRWLARGYIPTQAQSLVLAAARSRGLPLTADDLIA